MSDLKNFGLLVRALKPETEVKGGSCIIVYETPRGGARKGQRRRGGGSKVEETEEGRAG
jgi:hypothetical protein